MKLGVFSASVVAVLLAPFMLGATYKGDPVHSSVVFRVGHLGVSNVYGRFNEPAATLNIDDADPSNSKIEITLQTEKIDTAHEGRDKHLKSGDFFSAAEFPEIKFVSTAVKKSEDGNFEVTGDLTLHGVTKPITVKLNKTGEGKGMKGETRAGFETAPFTLKRSDFGMTNMIPAVGDEVTLVVAIEGIKE